MEPVQRVEEGHNLDSQKLIERGHLMLRAIANQARAARAEAQMAELEFALVAAQDGDATLLRNWMQEHQYAVETHLPREEQNQNFTQQTTTRQTESAPVTDSLALLHTPSTPSLPSSEQTTDPQTVEVSWDALLPHSRQRLAERRVSDFPGHAFIAEHSNQTRTSTIRTAPHHADTDGVVLPTAANATSDRHQADETHLHETVTQNRTLIEDQIEQSVQCEHKDQIEDEDSIQARWDEEQQDVEESIAYHSPAELTATPLDRNLDKPLARNSRRSLLVSVIVHSIVLCSLMAITMRIPKEVAGLGFESSPGDAVSETVEIAQTVDVVAPEVQPEVPSEPTSSAAMSMPSASGLSTTALGNSGVTTPTSSSSIASSADRAATTGSGKPSLSKVNTSFFGAGAGGNNFCYVIDGSESMRGGPWEAARAELIRSVSSLKETHRFYIVFFNQELSLLPEPGSREPSSTSLYATKENIEHAINWIESLKVARGAPPSDALKHAIELEPDAIYFLADGATKLDVPGLLKQINRTEDFISGEQIRVPIHAIAFYSPEIGQTLMRKIATENKGQYIYVPAPSKK